MSLATKGVANDVIAAGLDFTRQDLAALSAKLAAKDHLATAA
jgi:hypothetical protein